MLCWRESTCSFKIRFKRNRAALKETNNALSWSCLSHIFHHPVQLGWVQWQVPHVLTRFSQPGCTPFRVTWSFLLSTSFGSDTWSAIWPLKRNKSFPSDWAGAGTWLPRNFHGLNHSTIGFSENSGLIRISILSYLILYYFILSIYCIETICSNSLVIARQVF